MTVLSLFDGISCGQLALNKAGIKYDKYFASEIDKDAIKVTQTNFPNTIQLGDVTKISYSNGILKCEKGEFETGEIKLLFGGSPCQSFSINGKQKNFSDDRGKLFFEYVRILKEVSPKLFLLENVNMKKEFQDIISSTLNIEPFLLNSSDFSAQSRKRLFWTNIVVENSVNSSKLIVQDILENSVDDKYFLKNNYKLRTKNNESRLEVLKRNYRLNHNKNSQNPVLVSEVVDDTPSKRSRQSDRLYSSLSKSPTMLATSCDRIRIDNGSADLNNWRTLTPLEVERLQTVPDNYTGCISASKRFKCLGNGWTVDVIAHIFSFINKNI